MLNRLAGLLIAVCLPMITGCAGAPHAASSGAPLSTRVAADPTAPVETEKDLFQAVEEGRIEAVRLTLQVHPEWIDSRQHRWHVPPLHIAAWKDRQDIVRLLLDLGADVNASNKYGWRAIHEAAGQNSVQSIALLLDHKADLAVKNSDGLTPLLLAASEGHVETVRLLLQRGAKLTERDKYDGTLLHCAAGAGNTEMIRLTLDARPDLIKAVDRDGRIPLHLAATPEAATLLLTTGADPNAADRSGCTPLHLAAMFGDKALAETLIQHHADLNSRTQQGRTPLHIAAAEGQTALIELLASKGADTKAPGDEFGQTPLHAAAYSCPVATVKALLEAGAIPETRDSQGRRPVDIARQWNNRDVETLLLAATAERATDGSAADAVTPPPIEVSPSPDAPPMSELTETRVGPRGQLYVNGQPRILVGVWQQAWYLMEYHRNIGMDLMVCPPSGGLTDDLIQEPYAARAQLVGLGAVLHQDAEVAGNPALWGWLGGGWPHSQARMKLEEARCQPVQRAVFCNFGAHGIIIGDADEKAFYLEALRYIDVIVPHVWPEMFEGKPRNLRNIALMVDRIREWCKDRPRGEVSIWADINCHEWSEQDAKGGTIYTMPEIEEFTFQVWLALIHGADGICIFPISFDPFVYAQIPARYEEAFPRIFGEVRRFEKVLAAEESPRAIQVTGSDADGLVDFTTRRLDGIDYVFAVNGTRRPQTVRLAADGLGSAFTLHDALQDKTLQPGDGIYEEQLDGLAYRVWRLSSAATNNVENRR